VLSGDRRIKPEVHQATEVNRYRVRRPVHGVSGGRRRECDKEWLEGLRKLETVRQTLTCQRANLIGTCLQQVKVGCSLHGEAQPKERESLRQEDICANQVKGSIGKGCEDIGELGLQELRGLGCRQNAESK
jgi:hypothetical protein